MTHSLHSDQSHMGSNININTSTSTGASKGTKGKSGVREEDAMTRVKGCATMWHENSEEMTEKIKSLFRIDEDYSAR